ncbi:hypothetical protein FPCIR_9326 [Fusarium pseudocircinatum]|uniref:Uncharacterized protein n=1 Tax=Fusarium pseudocircinatum TaxID=56676 RepID=A0A8H5L1J2_9HYPO|nr:hypothetical protein FPCIR_9326 [Fusarium pseudocircinatum]
MEHYPYDPDEQNPDRPPSPQFPNDWEGNSMEPCSTFVYVVPLDQEENHRLVYKTRWERKHFISEKVQIELDLFTGRMFDDPGFLSHLRQLAQISHDLLIGELMLHCLARWPHEAALGPEYRRWMVGRD